MSQNRTNAEHSVAGQWAGVVGSNGWVGDDDNGGGMKRGGVTCERDVLTSIPPSQTELFRKTFPCKSFSC